METQICSKCDIEKPLSEFYYRKDSGKYRNECKCCSRKQRKIYCEANPDEIKKRNKHYQETHKEQLKLYNKNYRETHKEEIKQIVNEYAPRRRELRRQRRMTDKEYQIKENIRCRIRSALKSNSKSSSSLELLGCSIEFFKDWLEYNFYDDMNWENYGTHWSLEHVRACDTFDLSDPDQQKICFSWRNTSCLTISKNSSKSNKRDIYAELLQELKVKVYLSTIQKTDNANIKLQ